MLFGARSTEWRITEVNRRLHIALGATALALLLVATAALVLPACGLLGGIDVLRVEFCPRPELAAQVETNDDRERHLALEARLAQLRRQLDDRVCEPVTVAEAVPTEPPPPPDIDEEEWRNEKIDLLEGCWTLDSDYAITDVETGAVSEVGQWEVCFDAEGHGQQTLIYDSGVQCESSVTAFFQEGELVMLDPSNVVCTDDSYIYRREAVCQLEPDGSAKCISRQPEIQTRGEYRLRR